jgi:hypothetical protein
MSTTPSPALTEQENFGKRLRNSAIGILFALALLIPRLLRLRRNARSWRLFCLLLGIAGAALVILPLGLGNNYFYALVGLVMFIAAILLPPAKPVLSADDKARELRALVVVNGGQYLSRNSAAASVQVFVGVESISVLDSQFRPLLVIPVAEITSARAEESGEHWLVRVVWSKHIAEFSYRGIFAEYLARVAESAVRSVMLCASALPVIPQTRAAGA